VKCDDDEERGGGVTGMNKKPEVSDM